MLGILAAFGLVLALAVAMWRVLRLPQPYRNRACLGRLWRVGFPSASNAEIRLFLQCLVDGMGFSSKATLQFQPQDQVLHIYRSIYGGKTPRVDGLECESFLAFLSHAFGWNENRLLAQWHEDITLGELFRFVSMQAQPDGQSHVFDAPPRDGD